MSRRTIIAPDEVYHIYNRGTEKRKVFLTQSDYARFTILLYLCNSTKQIHMADLFPRGATSSSGLKTFDDNDRGEPLVDLCAYVLMPNHFHLLIKERDEGGIARFMQKMITGYTMYFNARQERSGALFQGKYKAQHVGNDRYMKYLLSYIHLNPIKLIEPKWKETGIAQRTRAKTYLSKYPHSSYLDYTGTKRAENRILSMSTLADYYDSPVPKTFAESAEEWLNYSHSHEVEPRD